VYLEEDERMLEEVYPQGEKVQNCFQIELLDLFMWFYISS
jgi:hypothetical protein